MTSKVDDANPYPEFRSFLSPAGVRYFVDSYDDSKPPATYCLAPRPELQVLFDSKVSGSSVQHYLSNGDKRGVEISSASFQAYKQRNEDRVFVHEFESGVVFGVFDGHGGDVLSDYASQTLPPLLVSAVSEVLAYATQGDLSIDGAVKAAIINTFQKFDADLLERVLRIISESSDRPISEWTKADALAVMQAHKETARKAIVGTTALVGILAYNRRDLWVGSLGDSEALAEMKREGEDPQYLSLNDLHNSSNPSEIGRLQADHPNEEGVVRHGRVLRALAVTRALGDMMFKVDPEISHHILKYSEPCFVSSQTISEWRTVHKTPPYVSSTPSVRHYTLNAGYTLVFASDGLRDALQAQIKDLTVTKEERARLLTALARGVNSSPSHLGVSSPMIHEFTKIWKERLGHGFIPEERTFSIRNYRAEDEQQVKDLVYAAVVDGTGSPFYFMLRHVFTTSLFYFYYFLFLAGVAAATAYTGLFRILGFTLILAVSILMFHVYWNVRAAFVDYVDTAYRTDLANIMATYKVGGQNDSNFWVVEVPSMNLWKSSYEIVGCVGLDASVSPAHLRRLYVAPTHRRQGMATALVRNLMTYAKERKIPTIYSETSNLQPAAQYVYSREGWVVGETKNYPYEAGGLKVQFKKYFKTL
ncbi:hypothetical protein D9758_002998 [Tetrapyrgos nigripes]|uniref:PPM-type phosphatase domain-containing protein n=1 Tax=Tetrapyrgos nigripes TaxID=182062 RepID=A0A8H5GQ30_9AGAR|nr:hypothetical protein D9758_002998 [Tetrapyrgos nigripes]